jgi:osmoprotectant transport system substrate-binding protein
MTTSVRARRAVALAVTGLLVLGACAADIPEADPADDGADALTWTGDDVDLTDTEVAIGSKEQPEQEILAWIAIEAARAAGASVHQEVGAGGTAVLRQAQLSGLIDAYWEYTGTGWTRILQQADPAGTPTELYDDVRDRDAELNQIDWLPPAPANSAYAIAATPETMDAYGVRTLADLAAAFEDAPDPGDAETSDTTATTEAGDPPATLGVCIDEDTGFATDADGLAQFERAFGVTVPAALAPEVATDELYEQVEAAVFCQFGQVLNTDPRLAEGTLQVLEDPGTFTIYNPSMTIRDDVAQDVPGFDDLMAQLTPRLDDATVRDLRAEVELDGRSPRDVARDWLEDEGLAAPRDAEGGS